MPDRLGPELLVVGIILLIVLGRRLLLLSGRGQAGTATDGEIDYGPAGAAICPRCGRPFARHILSPNLIAGKLSRCLHCGKWSIVPRATPAALAAAEAAQRAAAEPATAPLSEEERLRRRIEASRYE